jgi:hypothetical protein
MRHEIDINLIKNEFKKEGYILISTEYINSRTKLEFMCPNGHKHSIKWNHWKSGHRCGRCCGNIDVCYDDIKQSFNGEGYVLLSDRYINSQTKLNVVCPEGHEHSIDWDHWKCGKRCAECYGNAKITIDMVRQSFEDEGYVLLSDECANNNTKMDFRCPAGHRHDISWGNWQSGRRCGKCSHLISKPEKELKEHIITLDVPFIENDRTIIFNQETGKYLELDLWFPEKQKAIEFNGNYWHGLEKTMERDQYKKKYCEWKGIELLVIKESDWCEHKKHVQESVRKFLY